MNPKKELLWGLWVTAKHMVGFFSWQSKKRLDRAEQGWLVAGPAGGTRQVLDVPRWREGFRGAAHPW